MSKVPFLADIPIIGNLFKKSGRTKKKAELLIFVTPEGAAGRAALLSSASELSSTGAFGPLRCFCDERRFTNAR